MRILKNPNVCVCVCVCVCVSLAQIRLQVFLAKSTQVPSYRQPEDFFCHNLRDDIPIDALNCKLFIIANL